MNNILKKTLFFSPIAVVIVASIAVPLVLTIRKSETFFTLQLNDNTRESNFDTFFSKDKVNDQKLINEYTTAYNGGINPDKQKCLSILNKVLENYTPTQYGVDVLYSIWCSKFKYNLQDYRLGSSFDVAVRSITIDSSKRVSFSSECTKTNSEIKPGSNILKWGQVSKKASVTTDKLYYAPNYDGGDGWAAGAVGEIDEVAYCFYSPNIQEDNYHDKDSQNNANNTWWSLETLESTSWDVSRAFQFHKGTEKGWTNGPWGKWVYEPVSYCLKNFCNISPDGFGFLHNDWTVGNGYLFSSECPIP